MFIKSKIQFFESKSQHQRRSNGKDYSCLSSQRYNFLKANHNKKNMILFRNLVVYQVKDTIFWKQITTNFSSSKNGLKLFIKSKIQFFESKSQHSPCNRCFRLGCLSSQRYNFLKANHNSFCSKYTFVELFIKSKIQFFESKSQQVVIGAAAPYGCLSSQRYNFLKANHNLLFWV